MIELTPSSLSAVIRNTSVSTSITVTPEEGETINAISVTSSLVDPNITISVANDVITISGMYYKGYSDVSKYVSKGSSDLLETPTVVNSIFSLPPNKDLYEFNQDSTASITVNYTIDVRYDSNTVDTEVISQVVRNSHTLGYNILTSYYGG
jgi:hypothetical protein